MEFLSEANISRYNFTIPYDIYYNIIKTNKIYDKKDILNKQNTILSIHKYSDKEVEDIVKFCKDNNLIENYDNNQYLYFGDTCRFINDIEEKYFKNINITNKINNDCIDYINLQYNVKITSFPSLTKYEKVINEHIHSFTKRFVNTNNTLISNQEDEIIDVILEIYDNHCRLNIHIGKYDKKFNFNDEIINWIKNVLEQLNIEMSKEEIYSSIKSIQERF